MHAYELHAVAYLDGHYGCGQVAGKLLRQLPRKGTPVMCGRAGMGRRQLRMLSNQSTGRRLIRVSSCMVHLNQVVGRWDCVWE